MSKPLEVVPLMARFFFACHASPANCVVCQNEKKKRKVGESKNEGKKERKREKMPITATHHPEIGKVTELRTPADRGEKKALQN